MTAHNNTLDSLIERILSNIMPKGAWYEGECDASAIGTMIDATRYEADDFFQNTVPQSWVYIRTTTDGAAPIGESRRITDWVQGGGTATIAPNWSAAPGVGDTYAILNEYLWDEVKGAINMAIDRARDEGILLEKIDESVELASDVYEYAIPTGFIYIYRITMADGDGDFVDPIDPAQWKIVRGAPTPLIHFYQFPALQQHTGHYHGELWSEAEMTAGRLLRIEGLQSQEKLSNDTDTCHLSPEFVCYQAAAYLHGRRIIRRENDPTEHTAQAAFCQNRADAALRKARKQFPANSRRIEV